MIRYLQVTPRIVFLFFVCILTVFPSAVLTASVHPFSMLLQDSYMRFSRCVCGKFHSGDEGIRTLDPLLARQVLSQLSYTPERFLGKKIHTLKTAHTNLIYYRSSACTHCRSATISCHLILRCSSTAPSVCPCKHGHPHVPAAFTPSSLLGQAFVRLVAVSSIHYCTSTPALSTSSSSRGLISLGGEVSSWRGLHA